MSLTISKNGESTQELEIGGSKFRIRPCGWGKFNEYRRKCRNDRTLLVDDLALDEMIIRAHVLGWENVFDGDGEPLAFEVDLLLSAAPIVIETVLSGILAPAVKEEEEQADLETSSST